jgi:hypothetical protein
MKTFMRLTSYPAGIFWHLLHTLSLPPSSNKTFLNCTSQQEHLRKLGHHLIVGVYVQGIFISLEEDLAELRWHQNDIRMISRLPILAFPFLGRYDA